MNRYIDGFFILFGVFVSTFLLTGFATDSFWLRGAAALAALAAAALAFAAVIKKRGEKHAAYRDFVTYCLLDDGYADKIFSALYPDAVKKDGIFVFGDAAAALHLKLAKPSGDSVISYYKKFAEAGAKRGFVVCVDYDKQTDALARSLPACPIYILTFRNIYRRAKKQGLVPRATAAKTRFFSKAFVYAVFSAKNSYRFAACATALFLLSLLTPLKTYYIVSGFVCTALAVVARFVSSRKDNSSADIK